MKYILLYYIFISLLPAQEQNAKSSKSNNSIVYSNFEMVGIVKQQAADGIYEKSLNIFKQNIRINKLNNLIDDELKFILIHSYSEFNAEYIIWLLYNNNTLKGAAFFPSNFAPDYNEIKSNEWFALLTNNKIKIQKYKQIYKILNKLKKPKKVKPHTIKFSDTIKVFIGNNIIGKENAYYISGNNISKETQKINECVLELKALMQREKLRKNERGHEDK